MQWVLHEGNTMFKKFSSLLDQLSSPTPPPSSLYHDQITLAKLGGYTPSYLK